MKRTVDERTPRFHAEKLATLKVFLGVLLSTSLVLANPTVQLSKAERVLLNRMVADWQAQRRFASDDTFDKRKARAFLAIAEESGNPKLVCAAVLACSHLYTASPEGRGTRNGVLYERLPLTEEYKTVTLRLLAHSNGQVRELTALLAGECVHGSKPDRRFFLPLKKCFQHEPDGQRRANILGAFIYTLSADPAVAEILLLGLHDLHSKPLVQTVDIVSGHYRKGIDYGPDFRHQAVPLVQKLLKRHEPDLRYSALNCLYDMAPADRRATGLDNLFTLLLQDPHPAVVARTLALIAQAQAVGMLPAVVPLLDDTRSTRMQLETQTDDHGSMSVGDDTPVQHYALDCLQAFGFPYAYHGQKPDLQHLPAEAHRARAWLKERRS